MQNWIIEDKNGDRYSVPAETKEQAEAYARAQGVEPVGLFSELEQQVIQASPAEQIGEMPVEQIAERVEPTMLGRVVAGALGETQPGRRETYLSSLFPSTAQAVGEGAGLGRQMMGGMTDVYSLPFRGLSGAWELITGAESNPQQAIATRQGITRSPALAMLPVAPGAVGPAANIGFGAGIGALSNVLEQQQETAATGKPVQAEGVLLSTLLGGAIPGAAEGVSRAVGALAPQWISAISNVSEDAIRRYGTRAGRDAVQEAAGTSPEIAQEIIDAVANPSKWTAMEKATVGNVVENLPPIDLSDIAQYLDEAIPQVDKKLLTAAQKQQVAKIEEARKVLAQISSKNKDNELASIADGAVSLDPLNTNRIKLNEVADDAVNYEASASDVLKGRRLVDDLLDFNELEKDAGERVLNDVRQMMREKLLAAADATGQPEYREAMASWAQKLQAFDAVRSRIGTNASRQRERAERLVENIGGETRSATKRAQQRELQSLGDIMGSDLPQRAVDASYAQQLGITAPGMAPRMTVESTTGKSMWNFVTPLGLNPRTLTWAMRQQEKLGRPTLGIPLSAYFGMIQGEK